MRVVEHLFGRLSRFLGLEIDELPTDTLATAIAPYEAPRIRMEPTRAERAARIFDTLRADCEHYHYEGVDGSPNTPEKVWECSACGWLFRVVVNPEKPWFVRELVQVDDLTASHAVSGAVAAPTGGVRMIAHLECENPGCPNEAVIRTLIKPVGESPMFVWLCRAHGPTLGDDDEPHTPDELESLDAHDVQDAQHDLEGDDE